VKFCSGARAHCGSSELIKLASLASALADALREGGAARPAATPTAEAGIAVFRVAVERWVNECNQRDLSRDSSESRWRS
jgi:creatinine amidohydrolase/Fe(II)-dependent formamide hydrolase-like protein